MYLKLFWKKIQKYEETIPMKLITFLKAILDNHHWRPHLWKC